MIVHSRQVSACPPPVKQSGEGLRPCGNSPTPQRQLRHNRRMIGNKTTHRTVDGVRIPGTWRLIAHPCGLLKELPFSSVRSVTPGAYLSRLAFTRARNSRSGRRSGGGSASRARRRIQDMRWILERRHAPGGASASERSAVACRAVPRTPGAPRLPPGTRRRPAVRRKAPRQPLNRLTLRPAHFVTPSTAFRWLPGLGGGWGNGSPPPARRGQLAAWSGFARPNRAAPSPCKALPGFLRQDLDAVTAGLTLAWSSGVVEGHVNRVKTLKRAMYGRASFELLRARILTQA